MKRDEAIFAIGEDLASAAGRESGPFSKALEGAFMYAQGNCAAAYDCWLEFRSMTKADAGILRGANSLRPWSENPEWLDLQTRRRFLKHPINWVDEPNPGDLTVVFVADVRYYLHFADDALQGLVDSNVPVHFHIVGFDERCRDKFLELKKVKENISLSFERYDFPKDYTYFASARFFRLIEFLRAMGPVYVSDIDNIFIRDPRSVIGQWQKKRAGIKLNPWSNYFPWLSPSAAFLYLDDKPESLRFAMRCANYVDSRFEPNSKHSWYFDQLMLTEVIKFSKDMSFSRFTGEILPCIGRDGRPKPE